MLEIALAAALAGATQTSLPPAKPSPRLEFKGSRLGLSLAEWKALPFPQDGIAVRPVCSGDPDAAPIGLELSASERRAHAVACTYAFEGPAGPGPRKPMPISDHLMARNVRYVFRNGRLTEINYQTSVDAFDVVAARIVAQAGKADSLQRDTFPAGDERILQRVRMRWSGPAGTVLLTDPASPPNRLSVTYRQSRLE